MYAFDEIQVERNGRLWTLHWKNRYDSFLLTSALVASGVGTAVGIGQTLKQGRQAEAIAERRAQIDIDNAKAVRARSVEEAKIKAEKGRRLLATQKSIAAAGGIRINIGSPLVIEAETQAAIARDIHFGLQAGSAEARALRESAELERARGKSLRRESKFDALSQGLIGFGSLAIGAKDAGLFKKKIILPDGSEMIAPGGGFGTTIRSIPATNRFA